jgi:plastocyanin
MRMRTALLSLALVTVTTALACSSNTSPTPSAPTPPASDVTVNITGINGSSSFAPNPTTVTIGQRIVWKNTDTRNHDIIQDSNAFNTPIIVPGGSADAVAMTARGTFTYHCGIHPSMTGTVVVQ